MTKALWHINSASEIDFKIKVMIRVRVENNVLSQHYMDAIRLFLEIFQNESIYL